MGKLGSRLSSFVSSIKNYIFRSHTEEVSLAEFNRPASETYSEMCKEVHIRPEDSSLLAVAKGRSVYCCIGDIDSRGIKKGGLDNYMDAVRDAGEKLAAKLHENPDFLNQVKK